MAGWPCRRGAQRRDRRGRAAATLAALDAGPVLALANKESLIIGGPLVTALAKPGQIVPGGLRALRASPSACGPGRRRRSRGWCSPRAAGRSAAARRAELATVTPAQALAHPTWTMGPLVTVNSATLVNKGLEVIEAHLLFGFGLDAIDVVVHPQSIVHSMVEFADGVDPRPGQPAGHAAADRARAGLARPGRRRGPGLDWSARRRPGRSSRWTTPRSPPSRWPARRPRPGAPRRPSTTPPTRSAWRRSWPGGLPFTRIVDTVARDSLGARPSRARPRRTLDEVLAVDDWAPAARRRELAERSRWYRAC